VAEQTSSGWSTGSSEKRPSSGLSTELPSSGGPGKMEPLAAGVPTRTWGTQGIHSEIWRPSVYPNVIRYVLGNSYFLPCFIDKCSVVVYSIVKLSSIVPICQGIEKFS